MEQRIFLTYQGTKNVATAKNREFISVHFSHTCSACCRARSVLTSDFAGEEDEMPDQSVSRVRYTDATAASDLALSNMELVP